MYVNATVYTAIISSGFASDHTKPSTDPRYFSFRSFTTRLRRRCPYCRSARSVRPSVGWTAARSSISSDEEMRLSTVGGIMGRGQSTTTRRKTEDGRQEAEGRRQDGGGWKPEAGSRKLEAGSRKLEAGSWKPEAGSW